MEESRRGDQRRRTVKILGDLADTLDELSYEIDLVTGRQLRHFARELQDRAEMLQTVHLPLSLPVHLSSQAIAGIARYRARRPTPSD
jgi:hypothetical protein